jgi:hypothetical protein
LFLSLSWSCFGLVLVLISTTWFTKAGCTLTLTLTLPNLDSDSNPYPNYNSTLNS